MTSLSRSAQAISLGRPVYAPTLPCESATAAIGRALVRDVLGIWYLGDFAERAVLIVTEMIANAAGHTSCREVVLVLRRPSASWLRVAVVDREPNRLPDLGTVGEDDESGRGQLLIQAMADRWDWNLRYSSGSPWGKEVWAEIRVGTEG